MLDKLKNWRKAKRHADIRAHCAAYVESRAKDSLGNRIPLKSLIDVSEEHATALGTYWVEFHEGMRRIGSGELDLENTYSAYIRSMEGVFERITGGESSISQGLETIEALKRT